MHLCSIVFDVWVKSMFAANIWTEGLDHVLDNVQSCHGDASPSSRNSTKRKAAVTSDSSISEASSNHAAAGPSHKRRRRESESTT
jgi:hypothetical protein